MYYCGCLDTSEEEIFKTDGLGCPWCSVENTFMIRVDLEKRAKHKDIYSIELELALQCKTG